MCTTETRKYKVLGMNCSSCSNTIFEHVSEIDGVEKVSTDPDSGIVEIQGSGIKDELVEAAIVGAGYQLGQVD